MCYRSLRSTVLLTLAAVAIAAAACDPAAPSASTPPSSDAPELDAKALVASGAMLLDVRTPGEFDRGHLPHAVNVPVGDLARRIHEFPVDRPVVVYCRSGHRSEVAARALRAHGVKTVLDLGPMSSW